MRNAFAKRLIELRKEYGLSQRQVAKGIDRTQAAVSRWEQGLKIPDVETLSRLCKFFNTSADYLLGFVDEWGNRTTTLFDYGIFPSQPMGRSVAQIRSDPENGATGRLLKKDDND